MRIPIYAARSNVFAHQQQGQAIPFIVQNTTMSTQDPLSGHETTSSCNSSSTNRRWQDLFWCDYIHYKLSSRSSCVHGYTPSQIPDQTHGEPLNAPFGNGKVAISLMKFTDSPINVGSFAFTGNAFAFQTLDGKPFTVTYTIDAEVKSLTPQ